jgi:hypothetical protein
MCVKISRIAREVHALHKPNQAQNMRHLNCTHENQYENTHPTTGGYWPDALRRALGHARNRSRTNLCRELFHWHDWRIQPRWHDNQRLAGFRVECTIWHRGVWRRHLCRELSNWHDWRIHHLGCDGQRFAGFRVGGVPKWHRGSCATGVGNCADE